MRLFAETLLTDLSAEEIVTQLAEPELPLNPENAETRCRKLVKWGDRSGGSARLGGRRLPLPSARSRYQVSKLGGQFIEKPRSSSGGGQRTCGGAELLAPIVHSLDQIVVQVGQKVVNGPRSRSCRGYHRSRWLPHRGIPAPVAAMSARGLAIQRSRNLPTCQWTPIPTAGRPLRGS